MPHNRTFPLRKPSNQFWLYALPFPYPHVCDDEDTMGTPSKHEASYHPLRQQPRIHPDHDIMMASLVHDPTSKHPCCLPSPTTVRKAPIPLTQPNQRILVPKYLSRYSATLQPRTNSNSRLHVHLKTINEYITRPHRSQPQPALTLIGLSHSQYVSLRKHMDALPTASARVAKYTRWLFRQ